MALGNFQCCYSITRRAPAEIPLAELFMLAGAHRPRTNSAPVQFLHWSKIRTHSAKPVLRALQKPRSAASYRAGGPDPCRVPHALRERCNCTMLQVEDAATAEALARVVSGLWMGQPAAVAASRAQRPWSERETD